MSGGNLEVEDLLKIVLVLVIIWLGLEILEATVETLAGILNLATPVVGLVILALIVLWMLDRI